jgi:hypothetical protein
MRVLKNNNMIHGANKILIIEEIFRRISTAIKYTWLFKLQDII